MIDTGASINFQRSLAEILKVISFCEELKIWSNDL